MNEEILEKLKQNSIIIPDSCWLFNGASANQHGHCRTKFGDKEIYVHRLSAHIHWGFDLDSPSLILHKAWCQHPNCWNPEHLYEGTHANNRRDSIISGTSRNSGAINRQKTHCINGHEYNKENTYINKKGERICRVCNKERNRVKRGYYE